MARDFGDKLGPRLAHIAREHTLAIRRQLAPIEARISAAATQEVIDRAGLELGSLTSAFTRPLIAAHADALHPDMLAYLERISSGEHQWEGIAGNLQMSATSAISSVLSNYLFAVTGPLNSVFRNLPVDAQTAAQAAAAGLATYGEGDATAGAWGNTSAAFDIMYRLSQQLPGGPQLLDLMNRGVLSEATVKAWLVRSALPAELIDAVLVLAQQLLSPADAALAVLRGNLSAADGYAVAKANGLSTADFDVIIGNTGEPPAAEELLMLWRRGKIDTPTLERGIRQSRIRDEWIPAMLDLGVEPPSAADVLESLVQGEVSESEARTRWAQAGGDPTWFDTAYATTANSPAPGELAEMANRGIIPWTGLGAAATSFEQGFREGRWKDKWLSAFRELAVYHPPPREIATLVKEGGVTQDEAMKLWEQAGLSPDLAEVYWKAAHYTKTATAHALTKSEIVQLYSDRAISADTAKAMLKDLGYTETDANWEIDLADLKVARALLESAIAKIKGLYIAYKINGVTAAKLLAELDVPGAQSQQLQKVWDLERQANVKTLTAAEITDAWFYQLISPQQAQSMLEQLGYTPWDAWALVNIKAKGPIDRFPAPPGGP